jgi:hypothetical protein
MVDLLVLTSSDQLLSILKTSFFFLFYKTTYLNEVNCAEPSRQWSPLVRVP